MLFAARRFSLPMLWAFEPISLTAENTRQIGADLVWHGSCIEGSDRAPPKTLFE
jgi:hypothetical protein